MPGESGKSAYNFILLDNFPPTMLESYAFSGPKGEEERPESPMQQLRHPTYPSDMPTPGIGPDTGL